MDGADLDEGRCWTTGFAGRSVVITTTVPALTPKPMVDGVQVKSVLAATDVSSTSEKSMRLHWRLRATMAPSRTCCM
jgi:hypothetical protein